MNGYDVFKEALYSKRMDLLKDSICVVLVEGRYTPDLRLHKSITDLDDAIVDNSEKLLSGRSLRDGALFADLVNWRFPKPTNFQYAVIYNATTDVLMVCFDLDNTTAKRFVLEWNENGILKL